MVDPRARMIQWLWNWFAKRGFLVSVQTLGKEPGEQHYVGDLSWAWRLARRGIQPELSDPDNGVCSIGFCEREQKWYGWSHRAMFGFGVGSVIKEGDCAAESGWTAEWLEEHPEQDRSLPAGFTAQNLGDARRMAVAFADSVS